jgi:hypothetical protein
MRLAHRATSQYKNNTLFRAIAPNYPIKHPTCKPRVSHATNTSKADSTAGSGFTCLRPHCHTRRMSTNALVSADVAGSQNNTDIASTSFLSDLKSLYPPSASSTPSPTTTTTPAHRNPWHIITAVSYCASNRPDALPHLLRFMLADVDQSGSGHTERLNVVNEMRDGMFKAGLICGYARVSVVGHVLSSAC